MQTNRYIRLFDEEPYNLRFKESDVSFVDRFNGIGKSLISRKMQVDDSLHRGSLIWRINKTLPIPPMIEIKRFFGGEL